MTDRAPASGLWSDRCYWVRDSNGDEVLIPMCIGAAHHPSGCTCDAPKSKIERAEARTEAALQYAERLRQKLRAASERVADLEANNRNLRTRLREVTP